MNTFHKVNNVTRPQIFRFQSL